VAGVRRLLALVWTSAPCATGLCCRSGSDSVVVAATEEGAAVALKLDDGASRGRVPVLVSALAVLEVDEAALAAWREEPVIGGSGTVGSVVSALR
jgi:L-asparaginase II